jgi:peroxiredoxin
MKLNSIWVRQAVFYTGAVVVMAVAVGLILAAGLPERADYSGFFVEDAGFVAPEQGAVAPPFALPSLSGQTIDLMSLRGSPVVLNFWATWCEPCVIEMPMLQDVYGDYENVRLLAVNMGEDSADVAQWVQSAGLTFDILLDKDRHLERVYALRGQPSTFVIAPDGIIIAVFYGPVSEAALRSALAPYVKERGNE